MPQTKLTNISRITDNSLNKSNRSLQSVDLNVNLNNQYELKNSSKIKQNNEKQSQNTPQTSYKFDDFKKNIENDIISMQNRSELMKENKKDSFINSNLSYKKEKENAITKVEPTAVFNNSGINRSLSQSEKAFDKKGEIFTIQNMQNVQNLQNSFNNKLIFPGGNNTNTNNNFMNINSNINMSIDKNEKEKKLIHNLQKIESPTKEELDTKTQNLIKNVIESEMMKLKYYVHEEISSLHIDLIRQFELQHVK
jgi:hypothetical protein